MENTTSFTNENTNLSNFVTALANYTTDRPEFTTPFTVYQTLAERRYFSAVTFIVAINGFVGNLMVIFLVLAVKKLQTITNVFVVNLAVADTLTNVIAGISAVMVLSYELILPMWLCQCMAFGILTVIGCSVNTLALIAVNRLFAVTDTARIRYHKIYRPGKIAVMVVVAWLMPVIVAMIPVVSDYAELGYDARFSTCTWKAAPVPFLTYSLFVSGALYPLQLTIVLGSYIKIYLFVRKSTKAVMRKGAGPSGGGPGPESKLQKQLSKRQLAVTKNLFLVVCVFLMCLFPYFLVLSLDSLALEVLPYSATILLANSSLNPIIYGTKHPDFRVEFARIFNTCFGSCHCNRAKTGEHELSSARSNTASGQVDSKATASTNV